MHIKLTRKPPKSVLLTQVEELADKHPAILPQFFGGLFFVISALITCRSLDDMIMRQTGFRKGGHAGTLDPLATGLLIILLGKATRFMPLFDGLDKRYDAKITLGKETDSWDADGLILNESDKTVKEANILSALSDMTGTVDTTVPLYSAVKVDGRPLYSWTRSGIIKEAPIRKALFIP
jgi:tRNA pseudouridine55 synthase